MKLLALAALLPLATGPLPQPERELTASLCLGGEVTIPLGKRDEEPARDCKLTACHAVSNRERVDRDQGKGPQPRP